MLKNFALILLPHADDEIFALGLIDKFKKSGLKVFLVLLTGTDERANEHIRSCSLIGCHHISLPRTSKMDGNLHSNFLTLEDSLESLIFKIKPKFIACPLLEGGHQDHDSTCIVTEAILSRKCFKEISLYYYSTYYRLGSSYLFGVARKNSLFEDYSIDYSGLTSRLATGFQGLMLILLYRSQLKSWVILLIPYIVSMLSGSAMGFKSVYKITNKIDIMKKLKTISLFNRPLYAVYGRINERYWLDCAHNYLGDGFNS